MQKTTVRTAAVALLFILCAGAGFSMDLSVNGWVGNLGFRTDRAAADATFPGTDYFWGVSVEGSQPISDSVSFATGFTMDPILRNTIYTMFNYTEKILTVGVGPFFGLLNSDSTLMKSGISTAIKLELPGIAFVSFRSDSSIGGGLLLTGDYQQTLSDIALGFYVPNAICTLSIRSRSFEQKAADALVIDNLTEYTFSTDIFKKNVPYRLIVSFAYQSLSRSYVGATTSASTLNSLIIGTEIHVSIGDSWQVQAGIEGNVYSFGQGNLVGSDPLFLFRTFMGVRTNVDSIPGLNSIL
jgi:hypothetical protein